MYAPAHLRPRPRHLRRRCPLRMTAALAAVVTLAFVAVGLDTIRDPCPFGGDWTEEAGCG